MASDLDLLAPGQLPLFSDPVARSTDPATSWEAADDARIRAGTNRAKALEALRAAGHAGLTDYELSDITGVQQNSIGVRRHELVNAGYVVATDERRPAPSGSSSLVWVAVEYRREVAEDD